MKVVALDIATSVGIAVGVAGGNPKAWGKSLGKKSDESRLFSNALLLTDLLIEQFRPDVLVYEGAVGGTRTSHYLVGVIACVRGAAARRGVPAHGYNIGAIRKHFIGKHITSAQYPDLKPSRRKLQARTDAKSAVRARCRQLGWGDLSEDAADACAVWDYGCAMLSRAHQSQPIGWSA